MRRGLIVVLAVVLALGVVGGMSSRPVMAQDASPPALTALSVTIVSHEFSFEGPAEVPAGLVSITLDNQGEFNHHAAIFKLNDGVTTEQFVAGLETGEAFAMGAAVGGPGTIGGGGQAQVILRLGAGQYVGLCFVTGGDGIPHFAKGMVFPFAVSGEDAGEPDPTASAEVVLGEYSVQLPDSVPAGQQVWKVSNVGAENHQMLIQQAPEGVTTDAYVASLLAPPASPTTVPATPAGATPPPAPRPTNRGGMHALSTGMSGWAVTNLAPGDYVAVCFIPDPSGVPHHALGMVKVFTVQ